jgi:hypothetical protein
VNGRLVAAYIVTRGQAGIDLGKIEPEGVLNALRIIQEDPAENSISVLLPHQTTDKSSL